MISALKPVAGKLLDNIETAHYFLHYIILFKISQCRKTEMWEKWKKKIEDQEMEKIK